MAKSANIPLQPKTLYAFLKQAAKEGKAHLAAISLRQGARADAEIFATGIQQANPAQARMWQRLQKKYLPSTI